MKLSFLTISASFMILFTSCQEEGLQVPQDENLLEMTSEAGGSATASKARGSAVGPSASGHGTVIIEEVPGIYGEGFRHFSFHARVKKDGRVEGSGVITYIGGAVNTKFDINCLSVDGNHAIMSGVTKDGRLFWLEVFDNGEGAVDNTDQISMMYVGDDPAVYDCAIEYDDIPVYEIEGGNIQVRE
jgi:hypothetical protein